MVEVIMLIFFHGQKKLAQHWWRDYYSYLHADSSV